MYRVRDRITHLFSPVKEDVRAPKKAKTVRIGEYKKRPMSVSEEHAMLSTA